MLRLIIGPAGAGKTAAVIEEIRRAVERREGGQMLLVPEQYSHEAERELCEKCGDSLSLYGEVFSFTGLARRVTQSLGGGAVKLLDKGGRLLCMALALGDVGPRLRVYTAARYQSQLQAMLLRCVDELKSACVTAEQLERAAADCGDGLGDKLQDMALILSAYDAVASNGRADPADRLSILARQIEDTDFGPHTHIYVDGFTDFTYQEQAVLEALLKKDVELTVCLTMEELRSENEIDALSRLSARRLLAAAKSLGRETRVISRSAGEDENAIDYFAREMFRYSAGRWPGEEAPLRLYTADSRSAECEAAAAEILRLVRQEGCRWRDIAVAVRGFEDYRGTLESVFRHYGVPLFTARRSSLLNKPLPSLIALAYEICAGGWEVDDVISYLRTGLTGLSEEESDLLGDYVYRWQLRAWAWQRQEDWRQHPEGYSAEYSDETWQTLRRVNELRRRVSGPLLRFQDRSARAETALEQAAALSALLEELKLPRQLEERVEALRAAGSEELAAEYDQLWEIIVSALEQAAAILGDLEMDRDRFGKLFTLMLSQYDVGLIPVSLDRVSAGDFDRMRRRSLKHLIVLGCSDDRLPLSGETAGVFDREERERLQRLNIDLGAEEGELWREFSLIYNCLSLPEKSLTLCYSRSGSDGEALRPAFVYQRAAALFSLEPRHLTGEEPRLWAEGPALSLAAQAVRGGSPGAQAAADYFKSREPERWRKLEAASRMSRGKLSGAGVEALYGSRLRLSASRIDRFASCRFAYFCQYGLRAKPYEPAGFTPPEIGTFMHYVLEHVARSAKERGGFAAVSDEELLALTRQFVQTYVHEELNDFQEKSSRFRHLFTRLSRDVEQVVADMAGELRCSDFEPLDFELDFSKAEDLPPLELGEGGERLALTGIADRVDGWVHQGALYLRVVDYKTGRKKFSLSDVWYGMGLQMLLYLFALQKGGGERYGMPIVPAGVMYLPARNALLNLPREPREGEAEQKRGEELRRSGLVLDEPGLIEAWEKGEDKRYIPVKFKGGKAGADALASLERLGLLSRHIGKTLEEMAGALRSGSIAADPYYRSQQENACLNCDYLDACRFADGENGERVRFLPRLSDNRVWSLLEQG